MAADHNTFANLIWKNVRVYGKFEEGPRSKIVRLLREVTT
jgi:hypothetical protein